MSKYVKVAKGLLDCKIDYNNVKQMYKEDGESYFQHTVVFNSPIDEDLKAKLENRLDLIAPILEELNNTITEKIGEEFASDIVSVYSKAILKSSSDNKNREISEKQWYAIKVIEKYYNGEHDDLKVKFEGSTFEDASDFIGKYYDEAKSNKMYSDVMMSELEGR